MFKIGYNTNGFTSHSLLSALDIIGSLGYESVAITLDHHALNPWEDFFESQRVKVKETLETYRLIPVLETGARFLLNPRIKHEPTMISQGSQNRNLRIQFIEKCIDIARIIGAETVSIWSGEIKQGVESARAWEWLVKGCRQISKTASDHGIFIGFEPEPGMLVETLSQYNQLKQEVDNDHFRLTLDVGHAFITENSVENTIQTFKNDIVNIHLEDMKKNRHDHLFFGQGEIDFYPVFNALHDIGYTGPVNIELSRHSHNAVEIAQQAIRFVRHIQERLDCFEAM